MCANNYSGGGQVPQGVTQAGAGELEKETPETVIENNQERLSRGSGIIINTATLLNIVSDTHHCRHPQSWCH